MMDLKKNLVKPIAIGIAVLVPVLILQWLLGAVGFAPFGALAVNSSIQGILGLIATLWGVGYAVPKIPQFVDNVLKNL